MEKIERLDKIINERAYENCGINEDVLCAYGRSVRCNLDELDFDDVIRGKNITEIVRNLKELGIESFTISDQSSGLMKELHTFAEAGCQLVGFTKMQASEYPEFGTNTFKMKPALRLQVC